MLRGTERDAAFSARLTCGPSSHEHWRSSPSQVFGKLMQTRLKSTDTGGVSDFMETFQIICHKSAAELRLQHRPVSLTTAANTPVRPHLLCWTDRSWAERSAASR